MKALEPTSVDDLVIEISESRWNIPKRAEDPRLTRGMTYQWLIDFYTVNDLPLPQGLKFKNKNQMVVEFDRTLNEYDLKLEHLSPVDYDPTA